MSNAIQTLGAGVSAGSSAGASADSKGVWTQGLYAAAAWAAAAIATVDLKEAWRHLEALETLFQQILALRSYRS